MTSNTPEDDAERQLTMEAVQRAATLVRKARAAQGVAMNPEDRPEYMIHPPKPKKKERDDSFLGVAEDRPRFVQTWNQVLLEFCKDPTRTEYRCPAGLTGEDRSLLHKLGTEYNLGHHSEGSGVERYLIFKKTELFFRIAMQQPSAQTLQELKRGPVDHGVPAFLRQGGTTGHHSKVPSAPPDAKSEALLKRYSEFQKVTNPEAHATLGEPTNVLGTRFDDGQAVATDKMQHAWQSVLASGQPTQEVDHSRKEGKTMDDAVLPPPPPPLGKTVIPKLVEEIVIEANGRKRVRD